MAHSGRAALAARGLIAHRAVIGSRDPLGPHRPKAPRRVAPRPHMFLSRSRGRNWPDRVNGASLGLNQAELVHLREDVDDPPGLGDPPVDEPDDEDLVVGDGFAGWWEAHVLALVGPGDRVAADDLVALFDQILDRDVKVGERPYEPPEHLL